MKGGRHVDPAQRAARSLPANPDLRHLKDQAKDLFQAGGAKSLADAQFQLAREYGFASWPKLKAHVESLQEVGQLKAAIDANDVERLAEMMTRNPALHRAPLGYNKNGPLTWAAECRGVPCSPERLAIARWMLEHGSDVHQGGDGPLMRARAVRRANSDDGAAGRTRGECQREVGRPLPDHLRPVRTPCARRAQVADRAWSRHPRGEC